MFALYAVCGCYQIEEMQVEKKIKIMQFTQQKTQIKELNVIKVIQLLFFFFRLKNEKKIQTWIYKIYFLVLFSAIIIKKIYTEIQKFGVGISFSSLIKNIN